MKVLIGAIIAFLIDAGCRYFDTPVPSPPVLPGGASRGRDDYNHTSVRRTQWNDRRLERGTRACTVRPTTYKWMIYARARKPGATTLRSIGDITRHQRLQDSNRENVAPEEMLEKLRADSQQLERFPRITHELCGRRHDVATASLIEAWIDQTERRTRFLAGIVSEMP